MQPLVHLAAGALVSGATWRLLGKSETAVFLAASTLLDADHFGYYLVRFRDPSLRNAMRYFGSILHVPRACLCIFHTGEFVAALALVAGVRRSTAVAALLAGVLFHLALDLAQAVYWRRLSYRWWSLIYYLANGPKASLTARAASDSPPMGARGGN